MLFALDMDEEEEGEEGSCAEQRDAVTASQQADDNLALTFLRHLQSRFSRKRDNQFVSGSENIKHRWYLPASTGS